MRVRKIIHMDMDAFFAAVEQRDHPRYRGKPVVVGASPRRRGVVAACSYEARAFGVYSSMPSARAYHLCPQAIFVSPRFEVYRQVSAELNAIIRRFTDEVETPSLDEAYLDVTACEKKMGSATLIARAIKAEIRNITGLTVSAGVSYNKALAKIASDLDKPDGLCVITPAQGERFMEALPIRKIHGIGKVTEAKMHALGIYKGRDLKQWDERALIGKFGRAGKYYYELARAIDHRPVRSHRPRKSIGCETTFQVDLNDLDPILDELRKLSGKAWARLREKNLAAKTVTLKVKYDNFELITRSLTINGNINKDGDLMPLLKRLLYKTEIGKRKVRLLGVIFSKLEAPSTAASPRQLDFYGEG